MRELVRDAVLLLCVAAALAACSTQRKITRIDQAEMKAGINLPAR